MKRRAVIKRIEREAKSRGLYFEVTEGTNHTFVRVGWKRSTIGRHNEIPDHVARKFFDQFEGM